MLRNRIGIFVWLIGIVLYCYMRSILVSPTSNLMQHERMMWFVLVDITPFVFGLWLGAGVAGRSFSLHRPLLLGSLLLALPFLYYLVGDLGWFQVSGLINIFFRPDEPIALGMVLILALFPPRNFKKSKDTKITS